MIAIKYRLGALGFFASEELYNENLQNYNVSSYGGLNGIYDQINAIKWIKKYMSSFGGNGNDIAAFGESVGGCNRPCDIASLEYGLNFSDSACINENVPNNLTYLRQLDFRNDEFICTQFSLFNNFFDKLFFLIICMFFNCWKHHIVFG